MSLPSNQMTELPSIIIISMNNKQQNLSSSPNRNQNKLYQTVDHSYSQYSHKKNRNPEISNFEYLQSKQLQSRLKSEHKRSPFYSIDDASSRSVNCQKYQRNQTNKQLRLPQIKLKTQPEQRKSPYNKLNPRRAYLSPTANSKFKEKQVKDKSYGHKSICSVNCIRRQRERKKKQKETATQDAVPILREYLAKQAQANYPETQINRYLSRMKHQQDQIRSQLVYKTFFGIQPQFYKLETEYAKNLSEETHSKSLIVEKKIRTQIPSIPSQEDLPQFIQQYQPYNKEINMQRLLKSHNFFVQYSRNELFFGDMVGNSKQGIGIQIEPNKVFEGVFRNNLKLRGVEINTSGVYKGHFFKEKRNGDGQFQWLNGQYYIGQWNDGNRHGVGVWTNKYGDSYNGEWKYGKGQGYAVYIVDGQQYKGNFVDFKKEGWGKESFINGDKFEGDFRQGLPEGKGRYTWHNGTRYEGQFVTGLRNGKGTLKTPDGFIYKGEFLDERPEGLCQIYMPNGDTYHGYLREGRKNGRGTLFLRDSNKILDGFWQDDNFINTVLA